MLGGCHRKNMLSSMCNSLQRPNMVRARPSTV